MSLRLPHIKHFVGLCLSACLLWSLPAQAARLIDVPSQDPAFDSVQLAIERYKILEAYPQLTELDLQIAWEYNHNFPAEIAAAIAANEAA